MRERKRFVEIALLLLILTAAAHLRLSNLETTWMEGDQSGLLSVAMEFVAQGKIPLAANKSSAGIVNPPMVEYLYAIPLFLTHQIISVAWFTAAANLASVALCYAFVRRFLGVRVALLATLLYAVNPQAVHFSRTIWNPTMIPLFSTLALGCLMASLAEKKSGWMIGVFLALAFVVQLHWASIVLLGVVGLGGVLFHRRLKLLPIAAGVVLFAATFVPYLLYEQAVGFQDIITLLQAGGSEAQINASSALLAADLVGAGGLLKLDGPWSIADTVIRVSLWVGLVYLGVIALGSVKKAWKDTLSPDRTVRLILFLWTAVPIVFYLRHSHYLQHHYFLYLYPALQIVLAILANDVLSLLWRLGERTGTPAARWVAKGMSLAVPAVFLLVAGTHFFLMQARVTSSEQAQCVQLRHVETAIAQTQALLQETGARDLVVLSEGPDADHSKLGLLRHFVVPGTRLRFIRLTSGLSIPQGPTVYLIAGYDGRAPKVLDEIGQKRSVIRLSCEQWTFYTAPGLASASPPEAIGAWENGVQLSEYRVEGRHCPGREVKLVLSWDVVEGEHWEGQVHYFNHLVSPEGELVAQYDGKGVHNAYWFPGDRLINWFVIQLPPDLPLGTYDVTVGMYTWPDLARVKLLSEKDVDDRLWLTSVEVVKCEE